MEEMYQIIRMMMFSGKPPEIYDSTPRTLEDAQREAKRLTDSDLAGTFFASRIDEERSKR